MYQCPDCDAVFEATPDGCNAVECPECEFFFFVEG